MPNWPKDRCGKTEKLEHYLHRLEVVRKQYCQEHNTVDKWGSFLFGYEWNWFGTFSFRKPISASTATNMFEDYLTMCPRCPASSILSGQRQLDFPMLFEIPAAVGAVGKVGIARVVRDFQGRWEGRKTCFWFSSLSTARLFPQPFGRRVVVEDIESHFASADSKPASRFFLACSMR